MKKDKYKLNHASNNITNPLNNSTAKQQFSFSKEKRFTKRVKTEAPDAYYNLPSIKSGRNVNFSLGKGHSQLALDVHAPPPGAYKMQSDFDIILKKKYGNHFLAGRQVFYSLN